MSPYLRIAIGAVVATYITPRIINSLTVAEVDTSDATRNAIVAAGVSGAVTAMVYVTLGMAFTKAAV
jgi:hypothetical protein